MASKQVGKAGVGVRKLAFKKYFLPLLIAFAGLMVSFVVVKGVMLILVTFAVVMYMSAMGKKLDRAVRGAKAEEKIAAILAKLPGDYTVFHDITFKYGSGKKIANIDHVVVGPAGVFVVETKSHKGKVTLSAEQKLLLNARSLEKNFIGQVYGQISKLKEKLAVEEKAPFINGIVVFTNAKVDIRKPVKNLYVMNKDYLVKFILGQEQKSSFSEAEMRRVQEVLMGMMGKRKVG